MKVMQKQDLCFWLMASNRMWMIVQKNLVENKKNMKVKYTNRYNEVHTFEQIDKNTVIWEGDFRYSRKMLSSDSFRIEMVDPSGGPFLSNGTCMANLDPSLTGIIDYFVETETGYKIILK